MRPAEHFDAVQVPDRRRAKEHLVVIQVMAVEVDRRAGHGAAPEHVLPVVRPLAVHPANDRSAHGVGVDHVGYALEHFVNRRVTGFLLVDFATADDRDRGGGVL